MPSNQKVTVRPGITNPALWYPARPPKTEWDRIRKIVLERDNYTCAGCGHRALKYMNVHHLKESGEHKPENLVALCVACHAVFHMGRNLMLQTIEIWKVDVSQVEIIQTTRKLVKAGMVLEQIKKKFKLKRGPHAPGSVAYANDLVNRMGTSPRAYLDEPMCAIFVNFNRWQIE